MSNTLTRAVRDNRTIKNLSDRMILFLLADHTNEKTGLCCPSLTTLADESGMSRQGVMLSLNRVEQQGVIRRERGGGKGNHSTHYFLTGLESPEGRQYSCLPLNTHDGKNGAVPSVEVGNTVAQGRQYSCLEVGNYVDKVGNTVAPKQKEAEGLNQKKPSAATTTAKEPPASAIAAGEPFAPTDQSSHGISEKWIESLKSKYPQANGDYVESKCRKWCEEKRKPFTPEIFEKFLATEHLPKPKAESTKQSEKKKKPPVKKKDSKPKRITSEEKNKHAMEVWKANNSPETIAAREKAQAEDLAKRKEEAKAITEEKASAEKIASEITAILEANKKILVQGCKEGKLGPDQIKDCDTIEKLITFFEDTFPGKDPLGLLTAARHAKGTGLANVSGFDRKEYLR